MAEKKTSAFDVTGAFNTYYNAKNASSPSMATPLDMGKAVPTLDRRQLVQRLNDEVLNKPKPQKPADGLSYFERVFGSMQAVTDFANQVVSFGLTLPEKGSPLYNGEFDFGRVKRAWDAAGEISAGQAFQRTAAQNIPGINLLDTFSSAVKTMTGGKLGGFDKFMQDNLLYMANDFDIFDKEQRTEAFVNQPIGRWASGTSDAVAMFVLDPFLVAGKAYKGGRVAYKAFRGIEDLNLALGGSTGRRAERIRNSFNSFIQKTDDMDVKDLFRVKAIRESANPAALADILSQANQITDKAARHAVKADIIKLSLGDTTAVTRLSQNADLIAAKIAKMQDEVAEATSLGKNVDDGTGQLFFEFLNQGDQYDNVAKIANELAGELEERLLGVAANLKEVPSMDALAAIRIGAASNQRVIDLRTGITGAPVRLFTNMFYKKARGWIDFADNQSIQTVDNMLNQVRNVTSGQAENYQQRIKALQFQLDTATDDKARGIIRAQLEHQKNNLKIAEFTVERKAELLAKYAAAPDTNARARVFMEIEQELFSTVARQFGFDDKTATNLYRTWATARGKAQNLIQERTYSGKALKIEVNGEMREVPAGSIVRPIVDSDGTVMVFQKPLTETQLVHNMSTLDVNELYYTLKQATRAQKFGKKYEIPVKAKVGFREGMQWLDSFFKFQVLARVGYPVRSVTEGTLRTMSVVGPMAVVNRYFYGSKDLVTKASRSFEQRMRNQPIKEIYDDYAKALLENEKEQIENAIDLIDDPSSLQTRLDEINGMLSGKIEISEKFGAGLRTINGVTYQDALGMSKAQQDAIRDRFIKNSGQIMDDMFVEARRSTSRMQELTGDWVPVSGADAGWEESYLRVVNRQIRNSKMAEILFATDDAGKRLDKEQLINNLDNWLRRNPQGRKIMKDLGMGRSSYYLAEANVENFLNLFNNAPELFKIAKVRNLTAEDLKNSFIGATVAARPIVNGAQVGMANGMSSIARGYANLLNSFYRYVGEAPEQHLVNHPLFIELYRRRMDALVKNVLETYPGDEIPSNMLRSLENKSRQWARSEMRRVVYDTSERVEAAQLLRWFIPFFSSQADTVEKWSRIVINDPSIARSLQLIYNAPDRAGLVEERDGVKYINIPGEWVNRMSLGTLGNRPLAIPKPSLDLLFQGGAWWNPGFGWFVQIPASVLVKKYPELEKMKAMELILPYGPQGTGWSDILVQSPTARKIMSVFQEDNPQRMNLTTLIAIEENYKFDAGLRETKPTPEEINDRVKWILALEATSKFLLPFASTIRSPFQFYIDEWHRMREEDANTASDRFYEKYGDDFFIFTTSLSKNNTGIVASYEADKESKRLSDLISKEPEYGWFVVGDVSGEWSSAVYQAQQDRPIAPGSPIKFRDKNDPYNAIKQTNIEKGWLLYWKGMEKIEAERIRRGLSSLNVKDAEDLLTAKQMFTAAIEEQNTDWRDYRKQFDSGKVMRFLRFANDIASDSRINERPDIKLLNYYVRGREAIIRELKNRESQTLSSEENADLFNAWNAFTGALVERDGNGAFTRIYVRVLENDDLKESVFDD